MTSVINLTEGTLKTTADLLLGGIGIIINAQFNTFRKLMINIITPLLPETKPPSLNGDVVHASEESMCGGFIGIDVWVKIFAEIKGKAARTINA